ncbi:hypothetical protein B7494_g8043 [Chlorociboria aeruginascens]|nr:hypothetical protein B7494_g8043 [Chlorociboria aeruginascens]
MVKRSREANGTTEKINRTDHAKKPILTAEEQAVDPSLALLFASSAGPVRAPPETRYEEPPPKRSNVEWGNEESENEGVESGDDEELSSIDEDLDNADITDLSENKKGSDEASELNQLIEASTKKLERKRKRRTEDEDLEGKYMQKLAREEAKEEQERQAERRLKRQRLMAEQDPNMSEEEDLDEALEESSDDKVESDKEFEEETAHERETPSDVPLHETLAPSRDALELEKASRTVFLANVCTTAITSKTAKKALTTHMSSFLSSLPDPLPGMPSHKVESLRFRSTAYAGNSLPKKAAFAKKKLMAATTKSTNAYVVYSTALAAREAVKKLNATVILDRHLRVDGIAHPAKTDHRRCVFVGNLGFVDDESLMDQGGENERKRSKIPSDVEEGLWRQFGKAGAVESVRVVRDEKTRVGKGFAYVQFQDPNSVESALLFNEKKYPPMLPRILRVVRAKAMRKTALASSQPSRPTHQSNKAQIYNPKLDAQSSSLQGRAGKLLGRAGAAKFKRQASGANGMVLGRRGEGNKEGRELGVPRRPEDFVFEGYRATAKSGKPKMKGASGGRGKKRTGKPGTRSSRRGTEWKKGGGKKS